MKKKYVLSNVVRLMFAMVMVIAACIVVSPETIKATTVVPEFSFKNSGKSTVIITDEQCSTVTGELAYIKIKPKADGYLTIKFSNASAVSSYAYGKAQLYNGNKSKILSPISTYSTNYADASYYTESYGLKKNTQYYVAVLSYEGVKVSADFKKVKEKSGAKKAKAKTINKKKAVVGTILAGTKSSDWYKIKLTSKQKLRVNITPYLTDDMNITLSGPGVRTKTFKLSSSILWGKKDQIYTVGKVKTGTYYVKIQPVTTSCSGYYKLSWN